MCITQSCLLALNESEEAPSSEFNLKPICFLQILTDKIFSWVAYQNRVHMLELHV